MAAAPNFNNPNRWTSMAAAAAQNYRPPPPPRPAPPNPFNNPNRWTDLAAAGAANPNMFVQRLAAQNQHTAATDGGNLPAPPHPGAPAAPAPPGGSAPAPPGSSPLDSTYFANVAANQFKVNNDINSLGLQDSQAGTALQSTLGNLAYQQPRDQLALEQKANQSGGLYSSVYDQNLGNLTHSYLGRQDAAQETYTNAHDTIADKIAALQGGMPLYEAQQAADAAGRSATLAANNPGLGQGTGGLNTHPGTGAGSKATGRPGAGKTKTGTKRVGGTSGSASHRLAFNVGRTRPTLKGKPSTAKPPTSIRRTPGLPGHGLVRAPLGASHNPDPMDAVHVKPGSPLAHLFQGLKKGGKGY